MLFFIIFAAFTSFSVFGSQPIKMLLSGTNNSIEFADTGNTFSLPAEFIQSFKTNKEMLEDLGEQSTIPLPNNVTEEQFLYLFRFFFSTEIIETWRQQHEKDSTCKYTWSLPYNQLEKTVQATFDRSKKPYDYMMAINYLDPINKDLVPAFASLYADELENKVIPLDHIGDLKPFIAGAVLAHQLADTTMIGETFTFKADNISQYSSDKGILYRNDTYLYYYSLDTKTVKFSIPSPYSPYKKIGISSDDKYIFSLPIIQRELEINIKSKSSPNKEFVKIKAPLYERANTSEPPQVTNIMYDPIKERLILCLYDSNNQMLSFAFTSALNTETHFFEKITKIPFSSFKDDQGMSLGDSSIYFVQWQYIKGKLFGTYGQQETLCFEFAPNERTLILLDEQTRKEKVVMLEASRLKTVSTIPCPFIPEYEKLLNQKIKHYVKSLDAEVGFDAIYLRYLWTNSDTETASVINVLPQKFARALRFINQKHIEKGDAYDNIDIDAWWVSHAQRETAAFKGLTKDSPIITHISPKMLKIYPPYYERIKRPGIAKLLGKTLRSIKYSLGSLWYNTSDWTKLLVFTGTAIGGFILFQRWQEQKLLYPNKPAFDISTWWPHYAQAHKVTGKP